MTTAQSTNGRESSQNDPVNSPQTASPRGEKPRPSELSQLVPYRSPSRWSQALWDEDQSVHDKFEPGGRESVSVKDIVGWPFLLGPEDDPFSEEVWEQEEPEISPHVRKLNRTVGRSGQSVTESAFNLEHTPNNSPQWENSRFDRCESSEETEYESCPRPVVVERVDKETGEVVNLELPCNTKSCEYCGPKMRRRYVAHFTQTFSQLPELRFITLTLDPKAFPEDVDVDLTDFAEGRKYLLHIWERKFVKRVKRRSEVEVKYVASVERHESGQAHLHVVMSCTLSEDQLRKHWFESGGGIVMDATRMRGVQMTARKVGYVMKYVFKDQGQDEGRNSIFCSEGVGYHSEDAKENRQSYGRAKTVIDELIEDGMWDVEPGSSQYHEDIQMLMDELPAESEDEGDEEESRYEYNPPAGGGHKDNADTMTEQEREKFDRVAAKARTSTWTEWDGDHMDPPTDGMRYRYDEERGEMMKTPVQRTTEFEDVEVGESVPVGSNA